MSSLIRLVASSEILRQQIQMLMVRSGNRFFFSPLLTAQFAYFGGDMFEDLQSAK